MPISCHFRDCKALLVTSLTHVSGAIASVQTCTFTFMLYLQLHTNAAYRLVLPLWSSVVLIPIIIKRLTLR